MINQKMHEKIIILDFGGQYAHLIASRIRREGVLAEIYNPDETPVEFFQDENIRGIVLSGGPQSVYEDDSPQCDPAIFNLKIPVLGICYGHQWLNYSLNGKVVPGKDSGKEFGRAELAHTQECPLFDNIPTTSTFWMSHGDEVSKLGDGFVVAGTTNSCDNAAVWNKEKNLYGIQFHPEVTHSEFGGTILKNFVKNICGCHGDWTIAKFLEEHKAVLKEKIGARKVVLFVSGGVDSTVCFVLLAKILGNKNVEGIFVDTGLLRQNEVDFVENSIGKLGIKLTTLREAQTFLSNLEGKTDPEEKREIIGNTFLEVQRKYFAHHKLDENVLLAQGTIYPDTIETGATKNSVKIKTHHNRVPEIQKLIDEGKVIEPIADLYKDEVRALGELLGLPHQLVWRHPFPGPGLGVRILCSAEEMANSDLNIENIDKNVYKILPIKSVGVQGDSRTYRHPAVIQTDESDLGLLENIATQIINQDNNVNRCLVHLGGSQLENINVFQTDINPARVKILQDADHIVTLALEKYNCYETVWQFPVVLVPMAFDGNGKESVILRPINSVDAMSASVGKLPQAFFDEVTSNILKDENISAVFLDVTSKPPGTIEWE